MNLVGYIYNKNRPAAKPTKTYAIRPAGPGGVYTLTDPSYPGKKYTLQGINNPLRCEKYGAYWAVIIDEDDPDNFIWLNDMYGNREKGFILEKYPYGDHEVIVAIFRDRVLKLNAKLQLIPFVRADIRANKVLYFSTYGLCEYNNDSGVENANVLNKKIKDTEKFLEELKLGRKMILDSLG